jgi:DNA invertase Pin-like site-specific DNA recombinase
MKTKRLIAYYRVSTKRQGRSGLGLEAQQACIKDFAARYGYQIHQEFQEVETGTDDEDRPQLHEAIRRAGALQRRKACSSRELLETDGLLVIAKLDRLSRSTAFVATMMDSGVDFVCCDNPTVDRFTLHILAAAAENEARLISERTKAALAAAKRRGKKLGSARPGFKREWQEKAQKASTKAIKKSWQAKRDKFYTFIDEVKAWRDGGLSYAAIAERLNARGETTINGGKFNATVVYRLLTPDWRKKQKPRD